MHILGTILLAVVAALVWLSGHPIAVIMLLGTIVFMFVLWRIQRSPKIDLVDLFIDTDGKASWTKITAIGAFLVGSWAAVYLIVNFGVSAVAFMCFYLVVYSGAPVAYRLFSMYFGRTADAKDPKQPGETG